MNKDIAVILAKLPCSVDECDGASRVRGYCGKHYHRWQRTGSPTGSLRPTLAERLAAGIDDSDPDGCWPWRRAVAGFGYGVVRHNGRHLAPHRLIYALARGPIPPGLVVRHTCDNPPCCRLDHLLLGTQADNVRDMHERGRAKPLPPQRGADHPRAKLTEPEVRAIRSRAARGDSYRTLAAEYGLVKNAIGRIVRRETWQDLS